MRHYFSRPALVRHSNGDAGGTLGQLRPIPDHPGGMHPPPPPGLLTASARSAQGLAACLSGAIDTAVDLSPVAAAAHDDRAAGYSSCMRAVRHGVGRGVGTKLSGSVRRRADPQFWQARDGLPRRSQRRLPPEPAATSLPIIAPATCAHANAPARAASAVPTPRQPQSRKAAQQNCQ